MKIQFEVELTPEELRRLLGWPDMTNLQNMLIEQMGEKIKTADMETVKSMMKPFMFDGFKSADNYQSVMAALLKKATMGKVDLNATKEKGEKESNETP